jgi:hypothetical protein
MWMRFSLWGYQHNRKDTAEKRPVLTNGGHSPIHLLVACYALNAVLANRRKTQSDTCTLQIELAARGGRRVQWIFHKPPDNRSLLFHLFGSGGCFSIWLCTISKAVSQTLQSAGKSAIKENPHLPGAISQRK